MDITGRGPELPKERRELVKKKNHWQILLIFSLEVKNEGIPAPIVQISLEHSNLFTNPPGF